MKFLRIRDATTALMHLHASILPSTLPEFVLSKRSQRASRSVADGPLADWRQKLMEEHASEGRDASLCAWWV